VLPTKKKPDPCGWIGPSLFLCQLLKKSLVYITERLGANGTTEPRPAPKLWPMAL